MISRKAVGIRMNSAVAINARIFTSIISVFFTSQYNNSGFNPIEMIKLSPLNSIDELTLDDIIKFDQYHEQYQTYQINSLSRIE
jgi:hypothetical protein